MVHAVSSIFWNAEERRVRALWRLLSFTLLLVITTALLSFALAKSVLPFLPPGDWTALLFQTVTTTGATLIALGLAARFLDRRPLADYGFHLGRRWWLDFTFGLALGALLMLGIFLVEWGLGWIEVVAFRPAREGVRALTALLPPLILFLGVGFYEEAITRGYLLRNLAEGLRFLPLGKRGPLILAWVLTSLLFGVLHLGNPNATWQSTVNLVSAGLFLGLGYILTGELAIPIGVHITWNFFQGAVFGFPVSGLNMFARASLLVIEQRGPTVWTGGPFGPEGGWLGLLAPLVGMVLTWVWVRGRTSPATV